MHKKLCCWAGLLMGAISSCTTASSGLSQRSANPASTDAAVMSRLGGGSTLSGTALAANSTGTSNSPYLPPTTIFNSPYPAANSSVGASSITLNQPAAGSNPYAARPEQEPDYTYTPPESSRGSSPQRKIVSRKKTVKLAKAPVRKSTKLAQAPPKKSSRHLAGKTRQLPPPLKKAVAKNKPLHAKSKNKRENVTVKKGDTLYSIARRTGVSLTTLKKKNGLKGDLIRPGQKISTSS